jgi:hypothetical protein
MLSLFIAATRLESGGERRLATTDAFAGVLPSRIPPSTATPRAMSALRKAPVVKIAGSSTM